MDMPTLYVKEKKEVPNWFKSQRVQFGEVVILVLKCHFGVKYVWYVKFRFVNL